MKLTVGDVLVGLPHFCIYAGVDAYSRCVYEEIYAGVKSGIGNEYFSRKPLEYVSIASGYYWQGSRRNTCRKEEFLFNIYKLSSEVRDNFIKVVGSGDKTQINFLIDIIKHEIK